MKLDIKKGLDRATFNIAGSELSGLDMHRLQRAVEVRLACIQVNRCNSRDQTAMEKLNCIRERGRRQFVGTELRLSSDQSLKVSVDKSGDGFAVHISGKDFVNVTRGFENKRKLTDVIGAELYCAKQNRCGKSDQTDKNRLDCVVRGAKRRFAIKA